MNLNTLMYSTICIVNIGSGLVTTEASEHTLTNNFEQPSEIFSKIELTDPFVQNYEPKSTTTKSYSLGDLEDLKPTPSMIEIIQRFSHIENEISLRIVETDPSLLILKRQLRNMLIDIEAGEQYYGFNQIVNINRQITPESRLEAYNGAYDIIEAMLWSDEMKGKSDFVKIQDFLKTWKIKVGSLHGEAELQQKLLQNEGKDYLKKLLEKIKGEKNKMVSVRREVEGLLTSEEQLFAKLQMENELNYRKVRVTENGKEEYNDESQIAPIQNGIKDLRDALLSVRAKVRITMQWLMENM